MSLLFVVGILTPIVFWLEYVYIPRDKVVTIPFIGATSASNFFLGMTMGIGLLCVGVGAIHWAKKLMPDVEESSERHPPRGRRPTTSPSRSTTSSRAPRAAASSSTR